LVVEISTPTATGMRAMLFRIVFFAKVACVFATAVALVVQLVVVLGQLELQPVKEAYTVGFPSVKRTKICLVLFPLARTVRHEAIAAAVFV
jgi:hypothetical protein